jgi:hypothetical protein
MQGTQMREMSNAERYAILDRLLRRGEAGPLRFIHAVPNRFGGPRWKNLNSLQAIPPGTIGTIGASSTAILTFPLSSPPGGPAVPTQAAVLNIQGSSRMEGKRFIIRASGRATFGTTSSPTLNLGLYSGTSLTSTSNTLVGALASAASQTISTTVPFSYEAILQGDSTSGIVQGTFGMMINNTITAAAAITANSSAGLSGVNFASEPALQFVFAVTFGVSDTKNLAVLDEFLYGF